jgi:hypothetical protein
MVASKYTSDIYFANSRYAKIGGISLQELNQLELELLFMSEFQLYITLEELQAYADQLLTYAMTLPPPPLPVKTIQVCDTIKKPINIQPKPYNHCIKQQKRRNKAQLLLTPPYHPIINKVHPYSRRERNKV